MLYTVLIVFLVLMLVGSFPTWNHSTAWGYGPSGIFGIALLVILILLLTGRIG